MEQEQNKIVVFQDKQVRRVWRNGEWWFSITDVIEILTGSTTPRRYWSDLKIKLKKEGASQVYEKIVQLKLAASDGKQYSTDCANTETMFRVIQSVPSPKAEPFKQWLAKVGYERVQEIENPELAAERARQYYRDLGYDEKWIETRLQTIAIRGQLTDEWKLRGVKEGQEYAIHKKGGPSPGRLLSLQTNLSISSSQSGPVPSLSPKRPQSPARISPRHRRRHILRQWPEAPNWSQISDRHGWQSI